MATIRLTVALDPATLLEESARGLLPIAAATSTRPWPTLPAWIFFRQGGLRDDFHRLAAQRGATGWFDPTVCVFAELTRRWGGESLPALTVEERTTLLTSIMTTAGGGLFARSGSVEHWVPTVDRLIGELVAEGVSPAAFRTAMESRTNRDDFEQARDDHLCTVFETWQKSLAGLGRSDGRDGRQQVAQFIRDQPAAFAERLGGRRIIRLVGLADLRGGWRALLRALHTCDAVDDVQVISSHPLVLPPELSATVTHANAYRTRASELFTMGSASGCPLSLVEAPDAAREIEILAVKVRRLIEAGATPMSIAVLTREGRPGVDRMYHALRKLGVPVSARRRLSLSHTGPGRALQALLAAPVESWSRHALVQIAEQPLLRTGLDASVLQYIGSKEMPHSVHEWIAAVSRLRDERARRDANPDERFRGALPYADRIQATLDALNEWQERCAFLSESHTLDAWFTWVEQVLTQPEWNVWSSLNRAPANDDLVLANDQRALDAIVALATRWKNAGRAVGAQSLPIDAEVFGAKLAVALAEDLIIQPETGFGVVVAEALAGAFRSFDHIFLFGLEGGAFPSRQRASPVLNDREREALVLNGISLDLASNWHSRERELFRVVVAAARKSLTLSWAAMDAQGQEIVRSTFIDDIIDADVSVTEASIEHWQPQQVLVPGFPLVARRNASSQIAHASHAAAVERHRLASASPYNGFVRISELQTMLATQYGAQKIWSPTELESVAKCAFSWFGNRLLRLTELDEAVDAMDAKVAGTLRHAVLAAFFDELRARAGSPVFLRVADEAPALELLQQTFDRIWSEMEANDWMGDPVFRPFVRDEMLSELRAYVQNEMVQNENSTKGGNFRRAKYIRSGVDRSEVGFDELVVKTQHAEFRVRGRIDRVDRSIADDRVRATGEFVSAIDYKTSEFSTPARGKEAGWDDGVVLQLPLYAAALKQLYPDAQVARIEYHGIRDLKAVHKLHFYSLERAGKSGYVIAADDDSIERERVALERAGEFVLAVRNGEFPASPAKSCGCPPFCASRDICRIPGGPR